MPYGETLLDLSQRGYETPYQFTGYEKDQETGLHYAEARYYDSWLSTFNSTDPMWYKYPHLSPYAYCADNPVNFIDPDGRAVLPTTALKNNMSVYNFFKMAGANSVFKRVMNVFYSNQSNVWVHLEQLKTGGLASGIANVARTESSKSPNNPVGKFGQGRILLNSDMLDNSGNIAIDQTFVFMAYLHEGLHAAMFNTYDKDASFSKYPGFKDFVLNRQKDGGHHNQMAAFYRNTLFDGMKEFDGQMGTTHSEDWYNAMSWYGLRETRSWKDFQKANPTLAQKYSDIILQEIKKK